MSKLAAVAGEREIWVSMHAYVALAAAAAVHT